MSEIHDCKCTNEFQDQVYGKNKRLFNDTVKGYRCTVCGTEKLDSNKVGKKKK